MPEPVSQGNKSTSRVFIADDTNNEGRYGNYCDVVISALDTTAGTPGTATITVSNLNGVAVAAGSSGAGLDITLV